MNITKSKSLISLCKKYKINLLILFGSRAQNKQKENSDFDIAFYTRKNISSEEENDLFENIIKILKNEKIDLINIKKNHSAFLRNEIFSKGKLIYESSKGLFIDLKTKAWMDYQDFKLAFGNQIKNLKNGIEDL